MKIFISHTSNDRALAKAWAELFEYAQESIDVWYSTDTSPDGGTGVGKFRERIDAELRESDVVLAIFTPESVNTQWIFFECALALGMAEKDREVVPVAYYMRPEDVPSPLQDLNNFDGLDQKKVQELTRRLVSQHIGKSVSKKKLTFWEPLFKNYEKAVSQYGDERARKGLFYGHFHTYDTAKKLEGRWASQWTYFKDGEEHRFERDELVVSTTQDRIRLIGEGTKDSLYPMEGVVSAKGHVALSYWSQGPIPICGTSLLEIGPMGDLMVGTWEGFTLLNRDQPKLEKYRGRVVMVKGDAQRIDAYLEANPATVPPV